jgi:uncharacterized protein (TIGR02118 family)
LIKVTVFYPHSPGAKFDMAYYLQKHIPMVQKFWTPSVKGVTVEQGISGAGPGAPMTYRAIAQFLFNSVEEFQAAFEPHALEVRADVPNYTDIQPLLQISEVKL